MGFQSSAVSTCCFVQICCGKGKRIHILQPQLLLNQADQELPIAPFWKVHFPCFTSFFLTKPRGAIVYLFFLLIKKCLKNKISLHLHVSYVRSPVACSDCIVVSTLCCGHSNHSSNLSHDIVGTCFLFQPQINEG